MEYVSCNPMIWFFCIPLFFYPFFVCESSFFRMDVKENWILFRKLPLKSREIRCKSVITTSTDGGGALLRSIIGSFPPGFSNPDLVSDQKILFSIPIFRPWAGCLKQDNPGLVRNLTPILDAFKANSCWFFLPKIWCLEDLKQWIKINKKLFSTEELGIGIIIQPWVSDIRRPSNNWALASKTHARFQTRWLLKVVLGALNCSPDGLILMPACDFLRSSQPAQDKVPQVPFLSIYKSVTDQACSVHIRGYWPRFICVIYRFRFRLVPVERLERTWPISNHLDPKLGQ